MCSWSTAVVGHTLKNMENEDERITRWREVAREHPPGAITSFIDIEEGLAAEFRTYADGRTRRLPSRVVIALGPTKTQSSPFQWSCEVG